jgi:hypothetical protein
MWTRIVTDCFVEPDWRAPRLRPNRADMSRDAFRALVTIWCVALGVMLLTGIVLRLVSSA